MKAYYPAFHVSSKPGIDLSKHSMDIFYLVTYALVYFTGKSCLSNELNISGEEYYLFHTAIARFKLLI